MVLAGAKPLSRCHGQGCSTRGAGIAVFTGVFPGHSVGPTGALVAPQAASPPDRTAVHRVVEPMVKEIVPVGVPVPDFGVTTAR